MRSTFFVFLLLVPSVGWANDLTGISQDANAIERTGDVLQIAVPLGALGWSLVQEDYDGSKQLLLSYGAMFVATHSLKFAINRERPNGGGLSFPSGHTASAFSGAAFLQKRYGWQLGAPAYAMAAFTGYSRVQAKKHYWSDVFAGAALATGINHWLVSPLEGEASLNLMSDFQGGWQLSFAKQF